MFAKCFKIVNMFKMRYFFQNLFDFKNILNDSRFLSYIFNGLIFFILNLFLLFSH